MSNYYSGGYGGGSSNQPNNNQQQQPNDGFYNNTSNAAPPPPPQQQQQSQWTAPPQPQQQPQTPAFWNPAAAASVISAAAGAGGNVNSNAMLDLASSAGKSFFQSSSARMIPGLEVFLQTLRTYFAVDNAYVKTKMLKILFPFLSKRWKRQPADSSTSYDNNNNVSTSEFCLPLVDDNAPDLYLPTMSLITYVLLCALCYGNAGQFSPEVLPEVTSKCILTQLLEVLCIRFGFYMMHASVNLLDLWSYTGYKYLGLSCNMLVGVCLSTLHLGHRGYYITFLYTACACSYFMLKTMANNIPIVTAATGPKREVMVVAFAVSQFATMWFVSQTKFL